MASSQNAAPVTNSGTTYTYITFFTPGTYTGNVTNSGTLSPPGTYPANSPGSATGISVLELGTTLVGNIVNTGAINANTNNAGINIGEGRTANPNESNSGSVLVGSITNSGTITSPDDIFVSGHAAFAGPPALPLVLSTVTGSIINAVGGQLINRDVGINLGFATVGGSITNFGTITGTGTVGINVAFSDLGSTGTPGSGNIVNATGAKIASSYIGIVVNGNVAGGTATIAGSIINNGNITVPNAGTAQGIEVAAGSVLGGVTNTATIDSAIGIELFGVSNKIASVGGDIVNQGHLNALSTNGSSGGIEIFGFEGGGPAIVGGIINSGTISVSGVSGTNDGILLSGAHVAGGVTNSSTISASGGAVSVGIAVANSGGANFAPPNSAISGSVVNLGSITAGTGVLVSGGSTVAGGISNTTGGTITGVQTGIMLSTGGVVIGGVTNGGDLSGGAVAIDVSGEGAATTITQAGGVITGDILLSALGDNVDVTGGAINGDIDGSGTSGTVNFALGTGTFTYSNMILGVQAVNFNSGTVVLDGAIDPATLLINSSATLLIGNSSASLDPGITDNGTFGFDQSGAFSYGAIAGSGAVKQIGTGTTTLTGLDGVTGGTDIAAGTLVLGTGGSISHNVTFDGASATLQFNTGTSQLGGLIAGAAVGDAIDLRFQTFTTGDHAVWLQNGSTGTLTVETASNVALATLTLSGQYRSADFAVTADTQNDVLINLVTPTTHVVEDFNGDLISDALWRNSNDALAEWFMNGATISSSASPTYQGSTVTPSSSWHVAGTGDFNGDGKADILWQFTDGSLADWTMNGATISASDYLRDQGQVIAPDSSWSVAGMGDFNGDGNADILWRQSTTGSLAEWLMNGSTITSSSNLTYQGHAVAPDSSWSVAGIGDFNGGTEADILWRQSSTGALAEWQMNGSTIVSSGNVTYQGSAVSPDASWSLVGVGDFNGDGNTDILWRQGTTGSLAVWLMNGSTITSSASVTSQGSAITPNSTWNVVEVGNFSSGADAGILWQQSTTGALAEWQMNGSQIASSQTVTSGGTPIAPASSWQIQAKPTDFV